MKIYVVRHGQTELNQKGLINGFLDDALTPDGAEQARAAAVLLPQTIQRIYSSSLARARQTAEIINETLGAKLTFHDELKEVNFGCLNGTPFLDEYKEKHRMQDYDWRPTGECFDDVKQRVLKILKHIKEENKSGEALVVAHGGIIRLLHKLEHGELMGEIGNAAIYEFDLEKIV